MNLRILALLVLAGCQTGVTPDPLTETGLPDTGAPAVGGDSWWAQVQPALDAELRAPRPDEDGGFTAGLPRASTEARFDASGMRAGSLRLRPSSWARGISPEAPVVAPVLSPNNGPDAPGRVEYPRGEQTEWWASRVDGLELGWDLAAPPAGAGDLTLTVEVEGAWVDDDRALVADDGRLWEVGELYAWDADGVELPARIEAEDGALVLTVDDSGARYPIVIDPLLTTATSTLSGAAASSYAGYSVAGAGDVNNDGYDDVIVGAPNYNSGAGRAYVYLGSRTGVSTSITATLETGTAGGRFGTSVAGAGDINRDNYADVIVGEEGQNRAWVYLGRSSGVNTSGTQLTADASAVDFGIAVDSAGDVNNDNYADVVVGDSGMNGSKGRIYLYLGRSTGINTTAATTIDGATLGIEFGAAVAGAGDVNRDNYDDVVVGAPSASGGGGATYVYHGTSTGLSAAATTSITGRAGAGAGTSVAGGCDLNNDAYDDIVVGQPTDSTNTGGAAVYLGSASGVSTSSARSWTGAASSSFGMSVACLGDLDGDSYDDVAIGAPDSSGGRVYVYHGNAAGAASSAGETLSSSSGSEYGFAVGAAGDVNNDGVNDLIVGDYGSSSNRGAAYVYHGDIDADGDGYGASQDCNDANSAVNPGASETAGNAVDDDCDGGEVCYVDADNDGYRTTGLSTVTSADADCSDSGEALSSDPATDCNDSSSSIRPSATETVGDGVDQDCSGGDTCYADNDGDGYRVSTTVTSADLDCDDRGEALNADPSGDCDDSSSRTYPGATETVGDGVDQDCSGGDTCYADADNDGYRPDAVTTTVSADLDCADRAEATSADPAGDCDDTRSSVNPGATEVTADGIDNDCDSREACYADSDDDGFRSTDTTDIVYSWDTDCTDSGEGASGEPATDCADNNARVYPGATEVTGSEVDENCDGRETCYVDVDNDNYRPDSSTTVSSADADCDDSGEAAESNVSGDCNDRDASIHPGATESIGDGIDQDCDGVENCYADSDNDGYRTGTTVPSPDGDCSDSGEAVTADPGGDCDDDDRAVNPGATEVPADGVDNDCDNRESCYVDLDGDNYRVDSTDTVSSTDLDCNDSGEDNGTSPTGDCDDRDADRNPGESEITGDGIDQNCDDRETCWVDSDDDNYRTSSTVSSADPDCNDAGEALTISPDGDCNDTDPAINPGAAEQIGSGVDEDCDGVERCYLDEDDDGYRPDGVSTTASSDLDCDDSGEGSAADLAGDCVDSDPTINPGVVDTVGDGIDQDCDGVESCYHDTDGDGYRDDGSPGDDLDCTDAGEVDASVPGVDCDDADPAINPGATEVVADRTDGDCDGYELCYLDGDSDGHRPDETSTVPSEDVSCTDPGEAGESTPVGDCDDADPNTWVGAPEIPGDGIDEDCDGGELCWVDGDDDGYHGGDTVASSDLDCTDDGEHDATLPEGDCDDDAPLVNPDATEVCNQLDDDCNGGVDDGALDAITWAADADGDGYTDPDNQVAECAPPEGYRTPSAEPDCDDTTSQVSPGAAEVDGDGIDNNCDGEVDEAGGGDDTGVKVGEPGCGCASTPEAPSGAAVALLVAGAVALRRRRA